MTESHGQGAGGGAGPRRALRRLRRPAIVILLGAAIVAVYAFILSAGAGAPWTRWSSFNDTQAEGFRAGHLYAILPGPPAVKHWDYSYYQGHAYLYWGLLPPALLAAAKGLFHIGFEVGDETLVFAALLVRAAAGAFLFRRLARALVPRPEGALVALAAAVFALAAPTPFLLARAAVYEVSIAAGSAFAMCGLAAAVEGMYAVGAVSARRWFGVAALGFGLAAASRVSLWPAAGALAAVLGVAHVRLRPSPRGRGHDVLLELAAVGVPAVVVLCVCLGLNHARFDAWAEFGLRYQNGYAFPIGARFIPANVYLYLLEPMQHACAFPYLSAPWNQGRGALPSWLPVPRDYRSDEPGVGILFAVPFLWLAVPGGLAWLGEVAGRSEWLRAGPSAWVRRLFVVGAVASALPLLWLLGVTMRYEADFMTFLLPLVTMGAWRWLGSLRSRAARVVGGLVYVAAALATIGIGVLLGFKGYFDHFALHNPALLARLRAALDVCGSH